MGLRKNLNSQITKSRSSVEVRPSSVRRFIAEYLTIIGILFGTFGSLSARSQQSPSASSTIATPEQLPNAPTPGGTGSINGTVIDKDGAVLEGAKIALKSGAFTAALESGSAGEFDFTSVPSGPFELTISAPGFASQSKSGTLQAGQDYIVPEVKMVVATTVEINVTQTREEIAEQQIHVEEEQHLFGVIPNYYVSYVPDAAPLNARQKFELGWKFTVNPVAFVTAGAFAGIEQARNTYSGYGGGPQGYLKRYGAAYANFVSGTFFGDVIFPSLLKQDPRYFYKGTGTKKSRLLYAMAHGVICKGDNGHWQPNYSSVLGSLAAGGLSNLYYPAANRNGIGLTFQNTAIGLGGSAIGGVVQEFILHKVTTHSHDQQSEN
ncbi:MAG TPA: carboxypeptidase-like regulatory domain-containing protein [Candidatus Sulfotelmatobacter sp.]|nr:carboxypeptidase-like regulatory domain-containing protein [Candidatus Sulfotelmatobacter sp.]